MKASSKHSLARIIVVLSLSLCIAVLWKHFFLVSRATLPVSAEKTYRLGEGSTLVAAPHTDLSRLSWEDGYQIMELIGTPAFTDAPNKHVKLKSGEKWITEAYEAGDGEFVFSSLEPKIREGPDGKYIEVQVSSLAVSYTGESNHFLNRRIALDKRGGGYNLIRSPRGRASGSEVLRISGKLMVDSSEVVLSIEGQHRAATSRAGK
jgi:hypothetical protein